MRRLTLAALIVLAGLPASAAGLPADGAGGTGGVWTSVPGRLADSLDGARIETRPNRYRAYRLDHRTLRVLLADAPLENTRAAREALPEVSIPAPDGTLERFRIVESPVMAPALEREVPGFSSYAGYGVDDPTASVRFDVSALGFHATVRGERGQWYVDPAYHVSRGRYVSYYGRDLGNVHGPLTERRPPIVPEGAEPQAGLVPTPGATVKQRVYRLALVSDPAYSAYWTGQGSTVDAAKAVLMNRVNQPYNLDLAIKMVLIANNDLLNLDTTAKFSGTNGPCGAARCFPTGTYDCGAVVDANQDVVDAIVGNTSYDIGHIVLGVNGGGVAGLGVVGRPARKAVGCTGVPTPRGDGFAIDYVAHEMGHQFGGDHTFNGTKVNCAGGNRSNANAVEPGSGSSIQAYAGICGDDNLQANSDPYFSQRSIQQIQTYVNSTIAGATNGGTPVATANHSPVVTAPADLSIPARTPFTLTGTATDADGDALTYMWEQNDPGSGTALTSNSKPGPALFRQFSRRAVENPALSPAPGANAATAADATRTFPDLAQIASDNTNAEAGGCGTAASPPTATQIDCFSEFLPIAATLTARTLHFRLTVRDGFATGGGASSDDTVITIPGGSVPFAVTSQPAAVTVIGNTAQTVTWAVSGTTAAPYDVANVRILYSTDGGLTFPTELAAATANDGSEPVTVPDVATSQGRFKVEAVGNVFFDVSDGNLTVTPATGTVTTTPTETATETATEVPTETASSTATSSATATETSSPISAATSSPIASETTTAFPTVIPSSTTFVPLLTGGSRRPRATSTGRIRVRIGCAPKVPGAAVPPACIGRVKLRAVIDGRSRRIASRVFVRPGGTARRVRITLSRRARNALPLTARVIATAGLDRATKRIRIRAPR